MKKLLLLMIVLSLSVLVAACGDAPPSEGDTVSSPPSEQTTGTPEPKVDASSETLAEDYEDALNLRNQLALGILELEGTADAVNTGQASKLLPLWQVLKSLSESSTSAPEEMEAVQNQIMDALAPAQIAGIAAMRLTNARLQEYYAEIGVSEIKTPEPGVTPQSSSLKDLSPEEREAARATAEALGTPVGSGRSSDTSKSDVLLDNVIEMLAQRAGGS